jgi:hypothetical protein
MWAVWANHGALRWDKNEEKYTRRPKPEDEDKESQRVKDTTQTYIVASVLIATMAFSAILAIPGGYRADDHTNGGTPTLAGGLVFDAFIMATTLAFICSLLATTGFMVAGNPMLNLNTRSNYLSRCDFLFGSSVTCSGGASKKMLGGPNQRRAQKNSNYFSTRQVGINLWA